MKNIFVFVLFALTALTQVAFAEIYQTHYDGYDYDYHDRDSAVVDTKIEDDTISFASSVFVNANLGYVNQGMDGVYRPDTTGLDSHFGGTGVDFSVAVGMNCARLFAIYVGFGLRSAWGDWNIEKTDADETDFADFAYTYYFGAMAYPFRSRPGLRGIFGGMEIGNIHHSVTGTSKKFDKPVDRNFYDLKLKVGYAFDVTPHLAFGVTAFMELSGADEIEEYKEKELKDMSAYSLGVLFTVIRR